MFEFGDDRVILYMRAVDDTCDVANTRDDGERAYLGIRARILFITFCYCIGF